MGWQPKADHMNYRLEWSVGIMKLYIHGCPQTEQSVKRFREQLTGWGEPPLWIPVENILSKKSHIGPEYGITIWVKNFELILISFARVSKKCAVEISSITAIRMSTITRFYCLTNLCVDIINRCETYLSFNLLQRNLLFFSISIFLQTFF